MNATFSKIFLSLLCCLSFSPLAQAYVYPPSFVYGQWAKQTKSIQRLSYRQTVRSLDTVKPDTQQKVHIDRSGLFHKSLIGSDAKIIIGRKQASITRDGQKQAISLPQALSPFEMVWTFGDANQLFIRLDQLLLKSAHHQWFLSGLNKMWMHGKPQGDFLLMSPETYRPMLAQKNDTQYQASYSAAFSSILPQKIILFKNKQPYQEIILDQLVINGSQALSLFQP